MSTFTNSIGQTLQPGDKVLVISTGRSHWINERVGIFVGVSGSGSPRVQVELHVYRWLKPDGTIGKWGDTNVSYAKVSLNRVMSYPRGRVFKIA
jgi:hypothetical protein